MENASKALLMVAGVLVGVMIITLASYLFMTFGEYSNNIMAEITEKQRTQFNNNFYKYYNAKDTSPVECTMHDVVSLANFAKEYNGKNEFKKTDSEYYIQVLIRK